MLSKSAKVGVSARRFPARFLVFTAKPAQMRKSTLDIVASRCKKKLEISFLIHNENKLDDDSSAEK